MNLYRTVEPPRAEQPSYFNARESIIPKLPDTPAQPEIRQEVKQPASNPTNCLSSRNHPFCHVGVGYRRYFSHSA